MTFRSFTDDKMEGTAMRDSRHPSAAAAACGSDAAHFFPAVSHCSSPASSCHRPWVEHGPPPALCGHFAALGQHLAALALACCSCCLLLPSWACFAWRSGHLSFYPVSPTFCVWCVVSVLRITDKNVRAQQSLACRCCWCCKGQRHEL